MDRQSLQRISLWGRVLGVLTMISGGFTALAGLSAFLIGAIPGVITIWLGWILFKSGKEAKELLETEDEKHLHELLASYGQYLLVNGILCIVAVVFVLFAFFLVGASMFAAFSLVS